MTRIPKLLLSALAAVAAFAQSVDLTQPERLELINAEAQTVTLQGKQGVRIMQANSTQPTAETPYSLAMIRGLKMQNGDIELELAGAPGPSASTEARGFVGIAFRVENARTMEVIYLRPTNGRADDQIRRNHSVQYESLPDFPWDRLRREFPKKYETYVDLQPGVWTRVRISFDGQKARLYVHGSDQPTLIVNDLKRPAAPGSVALWIGPGTIAHFRDMKVTNR